ncbi:hypothetical protein BGZ97_010392 [Linnemannia gamsii]|uniref:Uncharacterized protein n=1 Tax=Linnemannia gamsii TaxID=64522 RepID=A0A9P6R5R3_9FUNG|nr:hypothetical protein BGZ97_010392 [Linnemannia gamsii]
MAAQLLEKFDINIDQPLGIRLDDYFSKSYELVTGKSITTRSSSRRHLALFIENPVPNLARHGLFYAICDNAMVPGPSVLNSSITSTTSRRVLMYYYYMRAAAGVRIWWKQYLNTLQIVQFVLDLGFIYFLLAKAAQEQQQQQQKRRGANRASKAVNSSSGSSGSKKPKSKHI